MLQVFGQYISQVYFFLGWEQILPLKHRELRGHAGLLGTHGTREQPEEDSSQNRRNSSAGQHGVQLVVYHRATLHGRANTLRSDGDLHDRDAG
jgi:hypothetical protein